MAPEGLERRLAGARPERAAVLEGAAALLVRRLPGAAGEEARRFLALWAAGVPAAAAAARSPEDVAGAALSLLDHARTRPPGQASVRVFNPRPEAEGWRSPHSIAEIVNDDMPFLVDSALAGLAIAGRAVHLVVHPIVPVRRDADGRLIAFGDEAGPAAASRVSGGRVPQAGRTRVVACNHSRWTPSHAATARLNGPLPWVLSPISGWARSLKWRRTW